MLTHIGGDVGIAVGQAPDSLDDGLRFDLAALRIVLQAVARAPLLDLLPPVADLIERLLRFFLLQQFKHLIQYLTRIADDRHIRRHRFRNRGRIDIDMQHRRIRAVLRQIVGCAIVKTHADGKDDIGVMHRHVGFIRPMHPQHT